MIEKRDRLLVATRVTNTPIHIGTYFGWLEQINRLTDNFDVILLIADLQSMELGDSLDNGRAMLKAYLKRFLHPHVKVVCESDYPFGATLGITLASLFPMNLVRRFPAIRALSEKGHLSIGTLIFPMLMAANCITFRASHVLRPIGAFNPFEAINTCLKRYARLVDNYSFRRIQTVQPQEVRILDSSGERLRRGSGEGILSTTSDPQERDSIRLFVHGIATPRSDDQERNSNCVSIKNLWMATGGSEKSSAICADSTKSCVDCKNSLIDHLLIRLNNSETGEDADAFSHPVTVSPSASPSLSREGFFILAHRRQFDSRILRALTSATKERLEFASQSRPLTLIAIDVNPLRWQPSTATTDMWRTFNTCSIFDYVELLPKAMRLLYKTHLTLPANASELESRVNEAVMECFVESFLDYFGLATSPLHQQCGNQAPLFVSREGVISLSKAAPLIDSELSKGYSSAIMSYKTGRDASASEESFMFLFDLLKKLDSTSRTGDESTYLGQYLHLKNAIINLIEKT